MIKVKADERLGMSEKCRPVGRHKIQKKRENAVCGMSKVLHRGSLRTQGNGPAGKDRERSLRKQTAVCSTGTAAGAPLTHESSFINW